MALINCPECGKEISDTCESCIHCGYKLSNDSDSKDSKNNQSNKKKTSMIVILLIIVAIIGIGIVSILVVNSIRENNRIEQEKQEQLQEQLLEQQKQQLEQEEAERQKQAEIEAKKLTYEEKVCYYAIEYLKSNLKNPESLQVHDIKISVSLHADDINDFDKSPDEHYSQYAVCIDYSGQNGFGGTNRNTYYIIMDGFIISDKTYQDQSIVMMYYFDRRSVNIDTDKIKYALDHSEVLDY